MIHDSMDVCHFASFPVLPEAIGGTWTRAVAHEKGEQHELHPDDCA